MRTSRVCLRYTEVNGAVVRRGDAALSYLRRAPAGLCRVWKYPLLRNGVQLLHFGKTSPYGSFESDTDGARGDIVE